MKHINNIRDALIIAVVIIATVNVIRDTSSTPEMYTKMEDGTTVLVKKSNGDSKGRYEVTVCQMRVADRRCEVKGLIPSE